MREVDRRVLAWVREHPGSSSYGIGRGLGLYVTQPGRGAIVFTQRVNGSLKRLAAKDLVVSAEGRGHTGLRRLEWSAKEA